VYAGAQFGTVVSMPISGLLAEYGFDGGWPSIFYIFGAVGTVWCIFFLWTCREDPQSHETIDEDERNYITQQIWGSTNVGTTPAIPWKSIWTSLPFFAILLAQ
jgi:MFS family permease